MEKTTLENGLGMSVMDSINHKWLDFAIQLGLTLHQFQTKLLLDGSRACMFLSDSLLTYNCFLKIFLLCMIFYYVDNVNLLSTFSISWFPAQDMEIMNMTAQAILLIRELLDSTIELRPCIDVFWQNSFRMAFTMMTTKK